VDQSSAVDGYVEAFISLHGVDASEQAALRRPLTRAQALPISRRLPATVDRADGGVRGRRSLGHVKWESSDHAARWLATKARQGPMWRAARRCAMRGAGEAKSRRRCARAAK